MDKLEICNIIKKYFNCWCIENAFCSAVLDIYYELEKHKILSVASYLDDKEMKFEYKME